MTSVENGFFTPYNEKDRITAANGQHLSITGIGTIVLHTPQNQYLTLSNLFFVPKLSENLISVGQLVDNGYSVIFSPSG